MIFAMARNRAIGLKGDIPWYIPDDLKRFKALTLGHPCIMGRKTFESIVARLSKPLPGRTSLVISRSGYNYPGVDVYPTIDQAITAAKELDDTIFICGGAEIYALALPHATHLYVTEVDLDPDADAFMPMWDINDFEEVQRINVDGNPQYAFIDYARVGRTGVV